MQADCLATPRLVPAQHWYRLWDLFFTYEDRRFLCDERGFFRALRGTSSYKFNTCILRRAMHVGYTFVAFYVGA